MSMFCFYPWFSISQKIETKYFELYPYVIGKDDYQIANVVDKYLDRYKLVSGESIETSVLLKLKDKNFLDELNNSDQIKIFEFSEIFGFCVLVNREYFNQLGQYANYDTLRCIIQAFDPNSSTSIAVASRRRDGSSLSGSSLKRFVSTCPSHVRPGKKLEPDFLLMDSLIGAWEKDDFEKYELSIFNFNCANTDSDLISPYVELVLMCSAFERLFEINNSKENELAKSFLNTLSFQKENKGEARENWIRGFYRARGQLAHGKRKVPEKSQAVINEYLLLSTFIFPILIKVKLQDQGLYKLTLEDRYRIYLFDLLIKCSNLFRPIREYEYKWNIINSNATFRWIFDKNKF